MAYLKGLIEKKQYKNCHWLIPRLWVLFGFFWNVWFQIVKGQILLDSDMSSEMVLSDILNKEHSFLGITTSWIYSSELTVLNMEWFYRLGLALFPDNWHMARIFSMALAIILLVFAVWLVFYSINKSELGIWAAAFVIFPGGAWYFWLALFGGYYLTFIYISLFSFALIMLSAKNTNLRRRWVYIAIIFLLGFGSGINGIKQLMVFYAPLILTSCLMVILEKRNIDKSHTREAFVFFLISICASGTSLLGYLINSKILSKIYTFKDFGETKIKSKSFLELFKEYIWSFGYAEDKVLLSPTGIASMCGVVFGLLVVGAGILTVYRFKKFEYETQMLIAFSVISIVFLIFIFSYMKKGNIEYYMTIVPLGYFLLVLEADSEKYAFKNSKFIITNLLIVLLLITSLGTIYNEEHEPYHNYRAKPELNEIVTWLKGGYSDGIASFWTANIITELSDGSIDMWTINDDGRGWLEWLQRKDHIGNFPSGRYFYLVENKTLDEDEDDEYYLNIEAMNCFLNEHPELILIYQDEMYTIYGVL